jgi:catechol 2,3-dioxygenase-like lactoylglutathione lyase family enzyme
MRIEFKRLNHVQLCIPPGAEDQAREFYGKVLGLEEIAKPDALRDRGGLWYQIADIQLHIGVEESAGGTKRHPAFEVAGLTAIRQYLQSQGTTIREEPSLPGIQRLSFFDPFGNRIELMEMEVCDTKKT